MKMGQSLLRVWTIATKSQKVDPEDDHFYAAHDAVATRYANYPYRRIWIIYALGVAALALLNFFLTRLNAFSISNVIGGGLGALSLFVAFVLLIVVLDRLGDALVPARISRVNVYPLASVFEKYDTITLDTIIKMAQEEKQVLQSLLLVPGLFWAILAALVTIGDKVTWNFITIGAVAGISIVTLLSYLTLIERICANAVITQAANIAMLRQQRAQHTYRTKALLERLLSDVACLPLGDKNNTQVQ